VSDEYFSIGDEDIDLGGEVQHVIALRGELDLVVAREVAAHLKDAAGSAVVVDLSGLTFIDASGLRMLQRTKSEIETMGHAVTIRGAPPDIRRVFSNMGYDGLLDDE
jgi:anti-sigma B factor antagonist